MDRNFWDIVFFHGGYNTNLVLLTTLILGTTAGIVGAFILLRKRTLISDAVSHACLPGIAIGFIVAYTLGLDGGKHLPSLMLGAAATGFLASLSVQWIHKNTRLNQDVAIGTVLGCFYALGVVLLSIIQRLDGASQAGLDSFLLGQVTGLGASDLSVIALVSFLTLCTCLLFMKDLLLLCFDRIYTQTIGKSVHHLDLILIILMLAVVTTGLKTVGLILILALLIIPPVTARFWTDRFGLMIALSGLYGALSCFIGTVLSAYITNMPSGGAIVLVAFGFFTLSLISAPKRGIAALYFKKDILTKPQYDFK